MGRPRRTWTWIALLVFNAACFSEPPIVGAEDDDDATTGAATTGGDLTSEPIVGSSGESESDHTTTEPDPTTRGSESTGDPDEGSGSADESSSTTHGPQTSGPEDGSSSSDDTSSSSSGEPGVWTCYFEFYDNDDGCDCGCGIVDPDCADATVDACDYCSQVGSCGALGGCPSNIDPDNNAVCLD